MPASFPVRLLKAPDEVRINYFANSTIEHPRLLQVTKQLWRALNSRVKESLIFVYGPAGVGKTTLCEHIINKIIENNLSVKNKGKVKDVPVAYVDAAAPENNRFDWRQFYQHATFTMESSVTKTKKRKLIPYNPRLAAALYFNQNLKPCEYRNYFIRSLKKYEPFAFFVDEAQNIAKVKSADSLLNQMDVLKTVRKHSNTTIVLCGPYDLVPFRNLSGQLSRRSWDIHFSRYTTSETDLEDFQSALITLQKKIPMPVEPDFVQHWKYVYAKSVGCVGIMKDWFLRALEIAVDEKQAEISFDILKECALSDNQCMNIALEISNGEQLVKESVESFQALLEEVGLQPKKPEKSDKPKAPLLEFPKHEKPKRIKRIGRRKAKRDLVASRLKNYYFQD